MIGSTECYRAVLIQQYVKKIQRKLGEKGVVVTEEMINEIGNIVRSNMTYCVQFGAVRYSFDEAKIEKEMNEKLGVSIHG
ncbi:MAG: hypothetical protein KQA33_01925 [Candidatus Aenigmarchaeota archaeon]|nr:hypothetical protein [Candidatus Aenigmarchaeota archaeon]